jgi:hypothetical protein
MAGAPLRVKTTNLSNWRALKTVSFAAPTGGGVLAIHGHNPAWRNRALAAAVAAVGEEYPGAGLLLACQSNVSGWRSLISSVQSPRTRVLGNNTADVDPAWATPGFDDSGWELPAASLSRLSCPSCGLSSEGVAPQPVWAPRVTQHAYFRISPTDAAPRFDPWVTRPEEQEQGSLAAMHARDAEAAAAAMAEAPLVELEAQATGATALHVEAIGGT